MKIWLIHADTVANGTAQEVIYNEEAANQRCAAIFAPIWAKHRGNDPAPANWRDGYELISDQLEDWISLTEFDISQHPAILGALDAIRPILYLCDRTDVLLCEKVACTIQNGHWQACLGLHDLDGDAANAAATASGQRVTAEYLQAAIDAEELHEQIDAECRKLGIKQTLRSRADMACIPAIAALTLDDSGLPLAYENSYHCDHCNQSWTDHWSCAVDDECACCGKDFSPEETTSRIPEPYAALFEMLPETAW